jgi:hypothetical protein
MILPTGALNLTPPSNRTYKTIELLVGAGDRPYFYPDSTTASLGTILHFDYLENYTLYQSSSRHPCYNNSWPDVGFNKSQTRHTSGSFSLDYRVTSTEPQWFVSALSDSLPICANGTIFSLNTGGITDGYQDSFRSLSSSHGNDPAPSTVGHCEIPHRTITTGLVTETNAAPSRSAHIPMNTTSVIESVNAGFISSTPCLFIIVSVFTVACAASASF